MALSASSLKVGDTHEEVVVDNLTRTQTLTGTDLSGFYRDMIHAEMKQVPEGADNFLMLARRAHSFDLAPETNDLLQKAHAP